VVVLLQAGRMLKFIRGKGQQPSAERQKLQNELFAFRKVSAATCIIFKLNELIDAVVFFHNITYS
jgi:hypothetical protein